MRPQVEDFGFSAVSQQEIEAPVVAEKKPKRSPTDARYKKRLQQMHAMIMPLLNNLKSNPEKEYIHWPNRVEKIDEFIKRLDKLVED